MTLTLELTPEVEQLLAERAQQEGQDTQQYVADVLAQVARLHTTNHPRLAPRDSEAQCAAIDRMGSYDNRSRAGLPPLTDDEVERDSIYRERGD